MLLAALVSGIFATLVVLLISRFFGPGGVLEETRSVQHRIDESSELVQADLSRLRKKNDISDIELIKKLLSGRGLADKTAVLLRTAGSKISVSVFMLECILGGTVLYFVFRIWLNNLFSFTASIGLAFLPLFILIQQRKKHLAKFAEHLPNALSVISSSIKAGHSLESSIGVVVNATSRPVCDEFEIVQAEMKLGVPLQQALENMQKRVHNHELRILITGISVHEETGGNLSEILSNLEKTIRDRFALVREINTLSAQGRFSAWILVAIPIVMAAVYAGSNPKMFMAFASSTWGTAVIIISLALDAIGYLWIQRIAKLKD